MDKRLQLLLEMPVEMRIACRDGVLKGIAVEEIVTKLNKAHLVVRIGFCILAGAALGLIILMICAAVNADIAHGMAWLLLIMSSAAIGVFIVIFGLGRTLPYENLITAIEKQVDGLPGLRELIESNASRAMLGASAHQLLVTEGTIITDLEEGFAYARRSEKVSDQKLAAMWQTLETHRGSLDAMIDSAVKLGLSTGNKTVYFPKKD